MRSRFCQKIGKFKIGVILVKGPMEIMEIRAFSKRWYEKTRACHSSYISSFHGLKLYFILIFTSFLFLLPEQRKQCNVSCFVITNFFFFYFIFQKVITSRVYKFSGCERNLLKEPFLLFGILKNSQLINCISSLFLFLFIFFGLRWCAITFHNNWMCHYTRKLFCLLFNLKVV